MTLKFSLKNSLFGAILLTLFGLVYIFGYFSRVHPNTYFANQSISGLSTGDAADLIRRKINFLESKKIIFVIDSQSHEMNLADLGVTFNSDATVSQIKKTRNLGFFRRKDIQPRYNFDSDKFNSRINLLLAGYEQVAKDATIVFKNGAFVLEAEQAGEVADRSKLVLDFKNRLTNLSEEPISVEKIPSTPKISSSQAQEILTKVNNLAKQRIILTFGQERWELAGQKFIDVLRFYRQGRDNEYVASLILGKDPVVVQEIHLADSGEAKLDISVDSDNLGGYVSIIAKSIDSPTIDATAKFEGDRIVEFNPAKEGRILDVDKTIKLVSERLSVNNPAQGAITIELPVDVTPAKIANSKINELGIRELVGRGISYFAGSIPNRVHNLTLGSSRISGRIIKPGETFSFNQNVGEVSGATGYKQAYVIQKGRTVLDDGGGICQVSTTVFRAALNTGLPIVARTAHAYRVGYYEQRSFKAGLDATVWSPAVDFQFKNDTAGHILVQVIVDSANAKLQVDIYGTRDSRRVELTDPVLSNIRPAPEPLYQDDPTLPTGTTKQVDFAAAGATAVFTRKVYKDDKLIIDDTFKSNFKPWQAIYLVGTGT